MELRTERTIYSCLALILFLLATPAMSAEGEWEWTRNAGWARMEGMAKGTPEEQLAYAREIEERGEFYEAARQYFLLVRTFPNSAEAGTAMNNLARCLFQNENFYQSFQAIETFIKNYPKSAHMREMMDLEYRIGRRFLAGARVSLLDEGHSRRKSLRAAVEVFQAIISHDGYGKYADKAYYNMGEALLELGEARKAKDAFNMVIARFPESDLVPLARYKLKLCNIPLGQGSVADAMQELERLRKMQSSQGKNSSMPKENQQVLQQSQEQLKSREATRMLQAGQFYEKRNSPKAYDAALFTYEEVIRRFPDTPEAKTAQDRIASLETEGKPDPDIGDRNFSLPKPSLKGLKKIKPGKLAFWRDDDEEGINDQSQPGGASGEGNPLAPQTVTAKDLQDYPALDVTPIKQEVYNTGGEGSIFLDLEAEEARLRNIESGAIPAEEAISPPAATTRREEPAQPARTSRDEELMPVPKTENRPAPQPETPAAVATPTNPVEPGTSQAGEGGTVVIDLSPEGMAEDAPRPAPAEKPQPQPKPAPQPAAKQPNNAEADSLATERGLATPESRPRSELDISPEATPEGEKETGGQKGPSVTMDATLKPNKVTEEKAPSTAASEDEQEEEEDNITEAPPAAEEKKKMPEKPANSGWIWGDDFK